MISVKYTGAATDMSGYAEAVRHDIGALLSAGVEVTTEIPRFSYEITDFGKLGDLATQREGRKIDYRIKILHVTPNIYGKYIEPDIYHIGRVFWETSKLPPDFAEPLKYVDEIWTGSEYNRQAILNSGVNKPIYIIPEAIDTSINLDSIEKYKSSLSNEYKFYSIFEWTERKNPSALLQAYWSEFKAHENVSLTIKTFVDNFHPKKRFEIISDIKRIKKMIGLTNYPPVYLYIQLLDRNQLYRFHKTFDCFVSAHRGEGWGIPQMEALLVGNPIISTNCGGIHEYLDSQKLIPYTSIPLVGNNRNQQWYLPDQEWADIDQDALRRAMRYIYENQQEAKEIGLKGSAFVKDKFSLKAVGKLMHDRLKQIVDKNYSKVYDKQVDASVL